MVEAEEIEINAPVVRRKRFEWFITTFIRPGKAMHEIACEERAAWLLPMILLTVLTIASIWVAGPLRQQAMLSAPSEPPPNFEWMSPEQQEQYMQAQASAAGTTQVYVFPIIGALIGLWLGWFLLGGILHLVLTMLGSRSSNTAAFNMAAWASLPFAIRLIVQIAAMLSTHRLISSPGLSGFMNADATGAMLIARLILSMLDLYLLWQILLLWIGAASTSGLTRAKAFSGVFATVLLLLALSALPGFLGAQFSGMNVNGPMMFF